MKVHLLTTLYSLTTDNITQYVLFENGQDCFVRSKTAKQSQVDLDPVKHDLLILLLNGFKNIPQKVCPKLESRQWYKISEEDIQEEEKPAGPHWV